MTADEKREAFWLHSGQASGKSDPGILHANRFSIIEFTSRRDFAKTIQNLILISINMQEAQIRLDMIIMMDASSVIGPNLAYALIH